MRPSSLYAVRILGRLAERLTLELEIAKSLRPLQLTVQQKRELIVMLHNHYSITTICQVLAHSTAYYPGPSACALQQGLRVS